MNETPIDTLQKKVDYYKQFLIKLKSREGLTKMDNITEKQFLVNLKYLISKTNSQINVYSNAIKILKKANLKT